MAWDDAITNETTPSTGVGTALNAAWYAALVAGIKAYAHPLFTTLGVANGGTGATTLADGGLVVGNATGAVEVVAAGTTSQILVGGGAATKPAWGTDIPTGVTIGTGYIYRAGGTDVPTADGGTGISTLPRRTIWLSAAGGWPSTTGGAAAAATVETATNDNNFKCVLFAADATTYLNWVHVLPSNYNGGVVKFTPYFLPVTSNASNNTIDFILDAVSYTSGDGTDHAMGTHIHSAYTVAADCSAKLIAGPESGDLTIGGDNAAAGGDIVLWRCYRATADTYTGGVNLIGIKITYLTNTTSDE